MGKVEKLSFTKNTMIRRAKEYEGGQASEHCRELCHSEYYSLGVNVAIPIVTQMVEERNGRSI